MKMYHITRSKNVSSILEIGIIPGHRAGITCKHRCKEIFLTSNPEHILKSQCGDKWCKQHNPAIMEIDRAGLHVKNRGNSEYTVSTSIPPNKIQLTSIRYCSRLQTIR